MIKRFFLMLIIATAVFSCKKDTEEETKPYVGTWNLIYFSKDAAQEIYFPGDIKWNFNKYDELVVSMDTVLPPTSQLPIKTPGVYPYVGATEVISIEGTQYAAEIQNDTLVLSHNATTGGPLLKFFADK